MKRFLMRRKKQKQAVITKERIEKLFEEAEKAFKKEPKLAKRYIAMARKIAMRTNVRFTRRQKRMFCKHCNAYLKPGINCRIRTRQGKLICHCLDCGRSSRMPYLREKKAV